MANISFTTKANLRCRALILVTLLLLPCSCFLHLWKPNHKSFEDFWNTDYKDVTCFKERKKDCTAWFETELLLANFRILPLKGLGSANAAEEVLSIFKMHLSGLNRMANQITKRGVDLSSERVAFCFEADVFPDELLSYAIRYIPEEKEYKYIEEAKPYMRHDAQRVEDWIHKNMVLVYRDYPETKQYMQEKINAMKDSLTNYEKTEKTGNERYSLRSLFGNTVFREQCNIYFDELAP